MQRVLLNVIETLRRADVVGEATDGSRATSHIIILPLAEEANDEVAAEAGRQNLREEVNVADERSLQNDGDVRRVEQLDGEGLSVTLGLSCRELQLDLEILHKRKSLVVLHQRDGRI